MKKEIQFRWWMSSVVLAIVLIVWILIYLQSYPPNEKAQDALKTSQQVEVFVRSQYISFFPRNPASQIEIIFYPGGLVQAEAYSPLANKLAKQGYITHIVKMPLNLAVFNEDGAEEIMKDRPNRKYAIGGHSLGGVIASRYATKHITQIQGVYFLASYTNEDGNLRNTSLPALSIVASEDQVLNWKAYTKAKQYLSSKTTFHTIKGGNHGQFGSYGLQKGDQPATITPEQQWDQVAIAINRWVQKLTK